MKYNKSHEWAKVDGDTATVGLSDFAQVPGCCFKAYLLLEMTCPHAWWVLQAELGDVVYVELPEVGTEVEQGNNFGVVESVKVHARAGGVDSSAGL